jgi:hypothetical protein
LASDPWFSDTGIIIGDKDSYQALRRKWIFEFAELSSIKGREVERVKTFLSSCADTYRPSYGRRTRDFPRQTIFAGSTNETNYLTDPTGARRFWPVRCKSINLEGLRRDRDQLWAEARARYDAGEPWHLETADLCASATVVQEDRTQHDDWTDIVRRWLRAPSIPAGLDSREPLDPSLGFTTGDVLIGALGFFADRIEQKHTTRVGHVLRGLHYERRQIRTGSDREWRYFAQNQSLVTAVEPVTPDQHENCPVTSVTDVTGQAYVYKSPQGELQRPIEEPVVTPVTGDADVEREAIQSEGGARGTAASPPGIVSSDHSH